MGHHFRLDGIVNINLIEQSQRFNIFDFGFDFNPRSLNFIQEYVFHEMLSLQCMSEARRVYLKFYNEKKFIIEKLVKDATELYTKSHPIARTSFLLNLSTLQDVAEIQDTQLAYSFEYNGEFDLLEVLKLKVPQEIILNPTLTDDYHTFVKDVFSKLQLHFKDGIYPSLGLKLKWANNFPPSLFDAYPWAHYCLEIDSTVQMAYRQVDVEKLKEGIKYYQYNLSFGD